MDQDTNPNVSQPKTAPEVKSGSSAVIAGDTSPLSAKPDRPLLTPPPKPPASANNYTAEPAHSETKIRTIAFVMIGVVGLAAGFFGGYLGSHNAGSGNTTTIEQQQVAVKSQGDLISSIAKNVGPSVVSIEVKGTTVTSNTLFRSLPRESETESAGTGVIISETGLIMTNRHVVSEGTTSVSVVLSDGTKFDNVTVVGRTNNSDVLDVAFLKIEDLKGTKLQAAKIGDSSKMDVGSAVVAIGNALGQFENTVTSGIISGHGRSIQASSDDGGEVENLEDLFQTDAAINQGNSGGPLVNMSGEVIGLNTAVASGDAQSIGFAIPINDVKGLIDGVIASGKLERPYLGVMYLTLTDDISKQYGLDVKRGAYIAPQDVVGSIPVIHDGPADKAGVKPGDVITKVDEKTIDEKTSLTSLLGKKAVGDKVKLTIIRDGKQITLTATLAAAPQS